MTAPASRLGATTQNSTSVLYEMNIRRSHITGSPLGNGRRQTELIYLYYNSNYLPYLWGFPQVATAFGNPYEFLFSKARSYVFYLENNYFSIVALTLGICWSGLANGTRAVLPGVTRKGGNLGTMDFKPLFALRSPRSTTLSPISPIHPLYCAIITLPRPESTHPRTFLILLL